MQNIDVCDPTSASPFSLEEFAGRCARMRNALDAHGLDGLLVTSRPNFEYLAGFDVAHPWASLSRPLVAILTREGRATLIVPAFLEREARAGSWIDDVRTHDVTGVAPVAAIARACRSIGLGEGRIGAELGREQRLNLSVMDFLQLQSALPEASFTDASNAIWGVRMVKSAAEVTCLRRACGVTARVVERIFAEICAGVSEREIAHRVRQLMLEEGADQPGWVMLTSGRGEYHRTFGTARDRTIGPGDMVFIDMSAMVHGYGSDFGRAGVVGGPTTRQVAAQTAVVAATEAGLATLGPGTLSATVALASSASLATSGLRLDTPGRLGHGLGLLSTEPPDISADDHTELVPGMVVTLEPTIIRDDGIYQSEQNIAVTADGYELLSRSPAHLRTIDVR